MPAKKYTPPKKAPQTKRSSFKVKLNRFLTSLQRSRKKQIMAVFVLGFAVVGIYTLYGAYAYSQDAASWNKYAPPLRQCESGGDYHIKTNSLYRGAYQFSYSTWQSMGGTGDPADADPATQDRLAFKLFTQQGLGPWPECGVTAQQNPYTGNADSTGSGGGAPAASSQADRSPSGTIDGLNCNQFNGWAYDPDKSSFSIRVDIYIDGAGVTSTTANTSRPDVNTAHGITGSHGFAWSLLDKFKDGKTHQAALFAIGVDANGNLNGNNPQITAYSFSSNGNFGPCGAAPTQTQTPTQTPAPVSGSDRSPSGVIDSLSCSQFGGWAFDPDKSSFSIRVDIYIDGVGVTSTTTNISRLDVNKAQGISGNHGFAWALPAKYKDGKTHKAVLYAIGVDTNGKLNGNNSQITAYSFRTNGGYFGPCK